MFSKEQVDVLYYLVEKGVISEVAVKNFLAAKLGEVGCVEPPAPEPAPEQPAEQAQPADVPPQPTEGQPTA